MMTITDRYAVFGNPIAHSKSPVLQAAFAQQTGQAIDYHAECVAADDFNSAAGKFFSHGGKGLNITVPFKQDAFTFAQQLTARAERAGAVNTLSIDDNALITGDNTDGVGLVTDITQHLSWPLRDKHLLILGAGGAVRGVLQPLIEQQPASITLANRTLSTAQQLAADFSDLFVITASAFTDLPLQPVDIIINATSASLAGEVPPLSSQLISNTTCCYDMMYSKDLTPFLIWAQQQGATYISDGLGMLVCQGAESFFIWRGIRPDTKPVIEQLRKIL